MLAIKLYRRSSPLVPLCRHLLGLPACWLCDSNILTFFFRTAAMSTPDQHFSQIFIHFIFLWMQYFPKFLKDPKVSENYLAVLFYQNCHLLNDVSIMPKKSRDVSALIALIKTRSKKWHTKLYTKSNIPGNWDAWPGEYICMLASFCQIWRVCEQIHWQHWEEIAAAIC